MGNGFWDSLKDTIAEHGPGIAKTIIKKGAEVAVNYAGSKLKDLANREIDRIGTTGGGLGLGASQQIHASHHIRSKVGNGFRPAGAY